MYLCKSPRRKSLLPPPWHHNTDPFNVKNVVKSQMELPQGSCPDHTLNTTLHLCWWATQISDKLWWQATVCKISKTQNMQCLRDRRRVKAVVRVKQWEERHRLYTSGKMKRNKLTVLKSLLIIDACKNAWLCMPILWPSRFYTRHNATYNCKCQ